MTMIYIQTNLITSEVTVQYIIIYLFEKSVGMSYKYLSFYLTNRTFDVGNRYERRDK